MRFFDSGPDIPNELLDARDQGNVVFICGAGVSKLAGLPLFRGLVEKIYKHLDASWNDDPAERLAYKNGEYDRVLKLLSDRMIPGSVDVALDAVLSKHDGPNQAHKDLLDLSTNKNGHSCIVTTNFDTLFERVASDLTSTASAALPAPNSERFEGIMHLHGRLSDCKLELSRTDLVLTSAQFGDAYLRSGWASRFVYDLIRCRDIILVGYQANDPPMRYLLEVVEADRRRFSDLHKVYAFAPFSPANNSNADEERSIWKGKGAKAILYPLDNNADHRALYNTLNTWADYARDPHGWRDRLFVRVRGTDPETLDDLDKEQVLSFVRRSDGAQAFAKTAPSGKWLKTFGEAGLLTPSSPIVQAMPAWLCESLQDDAVVQWCATSLIMTESLSDSIKWALGREGDKIADLYKKCWQAIFWSHENSRSARRQDWLSAQKRLSNGEISPDLIDTVVSLFTPKLSLGHPVQWPNQTASSDSQKRTQDILEIKFEAADWPSPEEAIKYISDSADVIVKICQRLTEGLAGAYEQAKFLGLLDSFECFSHDVPSVALHKQNKHHRQVYPTVRFTIDLWERLVQLDSLVAQRIARSWQDQNELLPKRMWLHSLTVEGAFEAADAASGLLSLSDEEFWFDAKRESMRLMALRWGGFSRSDRSAIEKRILDGPPRSLFRDDLEDEEFERIRDREIFIRLKRIIHYAE